MSYDPNFPHTSGEPVEEKTAEPAGPRDEGVGDEAEVDLSQVHATEGELPAPSTNGIRTARCSR